MNFKIVFKSKTSRVRWLYADQREFAIGIARLAVTHMSDISSYEVQEYGMYGWRVIEAKEAI
jgi:hypothetical protein